MDTLINYDPREHTRPATPERPEDAAWWATRGGPRVDALERTVREFTAHSGMSMNAAFAYLAQVLADRGVIVAETRVGADHT
jgi:hypothetical protein